ncbi:MAG: SH3 domain-containing protein [Desulfobulbaceae bacterium]|nr:SH3 domain-containing protein [Desulfobulbaceae bacterium]
MKQQNAHPLQRGLLLALFLVFFTALSAGAAEYVVVNKDGVNIRSAPGTNSEVLWEVFKNFPLQVLERKGQWVQVVDFEGDKGWIFAPLLTREKMVIVKTDSVNLRVGAGTNYEVVATVKYGVVFKPLEAEGDWLKVQHEDGTTGWLNKPLVWPSN